jgi:hypothetical protein
MLLKKQRPGLLTACVILAAMFVLISCGEDDQAVSPDNEVFTCSAGIVWTNVESVGGDGLKDIVWTGNKFVAVGNTDVWISTDGVNWEGVNRWDAPRRLAWSGETIVAVGEKLSGGPVILTSTDATEWTERDTPVSGRLWDVTWSGDQFVAVGDSGAIITSADGISWEKQTVDYGGQPPAQLRCVKWSGEETVALSTPDVPTALRSVSGTDWTFGSIGPSDYTGALDIAWVDSASLFVSVGADGQILLSQNGGLWLKAYSPTTSTLLGITWSGEQCVVVGFAGEIFTATGTLHWTQRFSGISDRLNQVAFSPDLCMWVGVGNQIVVSQD